jgi:hypothetical protein
MTLHSCAQLANPSHTLQTLIHRNTHSFASMLYVLTNRWPYRAVLSLPTLTTGRSYQEPILCESYYSTPEAAARAVDALCIVLLGRHAAVNFPASSYDAADLEDAWSYIRCVSGGVSPGGCCRVGHGMDLKRSAGVAFSASASGFGSGSSSRRESEDSMMY